MARRLIPILLLALLVLPLCVWAYWDPSIPAKWVQMPDETTLGIDVNASYHFILADDFECTEPGPITQIHIWGSWLNDMLPYGNPDSVTFILSFHTDIPAYQSPTGYSMPGDVLWFRVFRPGEFRSHVWLDGTPEGWMDPPDIYQFPTDYAIWQYNFYVPQDEWFYQQGTPEDPIVYWLDVKAIPVDGAAMFGWKSSMDHWNDDAVWGQGSEPYPGPWYELIYPPGHEYYQHSIDLAFVLVGEEQLDRDWGDAPDPPYPTLAINNGANHVIGGPWLGDQTDNPDPENDGQPDPSALGDDTWDGNDDEDGVQIPVLMQGTTSTITFEVYDAAGGGGWVEGWIDFNGDGTWDASELVYSAYCPVGVYAFNVTTPSSAVVGQTFARFRISTAGGLTWVGAAADGEVEDHEVWIEEGTQGFKWQQPPDLSPQGVDVDATEPFILSDDFLCKEPGRITLIEIWGSWLNDWYPFGTDPTAVDFILSFHKNIPMGPDGYSIPGALLWLRNFIVGEFEVVPYAANIEEGWMIPPTDYWFPADWTCWLYRFYVPVADAFFQRGTESNPIVYWLDVQAIPHDPDAIFGWKTSVIHWNDDAVWGYGPEPYLDPWYELRYPPNHPYYPESIDLAFRLTNEPSSGVPEHETLPEGLGLFQNVPNPFTSATTIRYNLPGGGGHVKLEIYDVTGRLVSTLVDDVQQGGVYSVEWSGTNDAGRELPAGIYFQRLSLDNQEISQKMLLMR
jgi:hypothetical protein